MIDKSLFFKKFLLGQRSYITSYHKNEYVDELRECQVSFWHVPRSTETMHPNQISPQSDIVFDDSIKIVRYITCVHEELKQYSPRIRNDQLKTHNTALQMFVRL